MSQGEKANAGGSGPVKPGITRRQRRAMREKANAARRAAFWAPLAEWRANLEVA